MHETDQHVWRWCLCPISPPPHPHPPFFVVPPSVGVAALDLCRWVSNGLLPLQDWVDDKRNLSRDRVMALSPGGVGFLRMHFRNRAVPTPSFVHNHMCTLARAMQVRGACAARGWDVQVVLAHAHSDPAMLLACP